MKSTIQLTKVREYDGHEIEIEADSEEQAKIIYLSMIENDEIQLEETSSDNDWYCKESEEK